MIYIYYIYIINAYNINDNEKLVFISNLLNILQVIFCNDKYAYSIYIYLLVYSAKFLSQWTVISQICHLSLLCLFIILQSSNDTFSSGYLVIFQILIVCLHQQFYPSVMFDIQESLLCKVKTLPSTISLEHLEFFSITNLHIAFLLYNFTRVSHSVLITTL